MPTYQYACTACGHRLEAVQSFTDSPLTECPECAGRLRKLFSSVGIVFKGSGFYRTDSRSDSSAAKNGSGSNGSSPAKDGAGKETAGSGTTNGSAKSGTDSGSGSSSSGSTSTTSTSSTPANAAA